jgi:RecB family exonuclease
MYLFSPAAQGLGAWSPSKIKTGEQCPWKFNRQYVEKLRVPDDKMPELDDTALRVGSAVHYYAECMGKGKPRHFAYNEARSRNSLVSDEVDTFDSMLPNTDKFLARIATFKERFNVTEDLIERKIGVNLELLDADFWDDDAILRGVIDRALIIDDKYAVMIDIKTSSFATLKYSQLQLECYALMAFANWPNLEYVHSALYFVPDGKFLWADKVYASGYPLGESNTVVQTINSTAAHVESDEICPGNYCSWCKYKPICLDERKVRRASKRAAAKAIKMGESG